MTPSPSSSARRRKRLVEAAVEFALAAIFLATVYFAARMGDSGVAPPFKLLAALLPVGVLSAWLAFSFGRLRGHDELERSIEYRALAAAGWGAVLIVTASGLLTTLVDAPALPPYFGAPIAAGIYGVLRAIIALRYR